MSIYTILDWINFWQLFFFDSTWHCVNTNSYHRNNGKQKNGHFLRSKRIQCLVYRLYLGLYMWSTVDLLINDSKLCLNQMHNYLIHFVCRQLESLVENQFVRLIVYILIIKCIYKLRQSTFQPINNPFRIEIQSIR